MSVTVLNTDAGISGKTLADTESAQTVTGLKTFDRDPNAPFGVTASSAVVANLDADKLDGQEGAYYLSEPNAAPVVAVLSDGATPALDASLGSVFRLSAAGDRTIAIPTNAVAGKKIIIEHYASGGARTLALNTGAGGFRFGSDIAALTQTASGKTDYIGAIYNGTDSFWDIVAYVKSF